MKTEEPKYQVEEPRKLKSWEQIAKKEILKWLDSQEYRDEIQRTVMPNEDLGPFTKFLYHFAFLCKCGWGVMIDFDEYKQRVFLPDHYYKWMHKLRDELMEVNTSPAKR